MNSDRKNTADTIGNGSCPGRSSAVALLTIIALSGCSSSVGDQVATAAQEAGGDGWPTYGGGNHNRNFSDLTQINQDNVADLEVAWTYHYGTGEHDLGDLGLDYRFEVTPLVVDGVMYISTPTSPNAPGVASTVTALEPETGDVLWKYESPRNIHGRGIAYWPGDQETAPRIIFGTDDGYVMAVDVVTGEAAADFGRHGEIDAYIGVTSEVVGDSRRSTYTIPNPVTIYKDLLITGARPGEAGPPGPRGDIRAFSVRTGRLVWTFHTLPRKGESNPSELKRVGVPDLTGANVWSTMTLDEDNGILYATTGDINGPRRGTPVDGPEPFANTLLALDADNGELVWYSKITFKDLWDWDLPTPTVLLDVERDGQTIPAVLLTGKQSLVFLYNRLTGETLNGYELLDAPKTDVPGLDYWPVQPFPSAPEPLARTMMTRDEIPDVVPGMREHCEQVWDEHNILSEGLYGLPQTDRGTLKYPASTGGPNWGGGSYNPNLGYYFVNLKNNPRLTPASQGYRDPAPGAPDSNFRYELDDGTRLTCGALPWGELVALDVRNLKIAWRSTLGIKPELGEAGMHTGTENLGGNISTASGLVFIGATNDRHFRSFAAESGELLWDTELPASAHSTPITYRGRDGKQYVVVAAGGGTSVGKKRMSDSVVAFALPASSH